MSTTALNGEKKVFIYNSTVDSLAMREHFMCCITEKRIVHISGVRVILTTMSDIRKIYEIYIILILSSSLNLRGFV